MATGVLAVISIDPGRFTKHPDRPLDVAFLLVAAVVLNVPQVRIDSGRLTLSGIAIASAALLANPIDAALVGIVSSSTFWRRGTFPILGNAIVCATIGFGGSFVATGLRVENSLSFGARILVLGTCFVVNILLVSIAFQIRTGATVKRLFKQNFGLSFYVALTYISLAALLVSYLLDGSLTGYVLAAVVCVLAFALTDTIAGRRVRRVLESELSDADRHLFHSRAVEGVVHNLRNHIATTVGYLKEIDIKRLDPVDREAVETATAAADDAAVVLRGLAQGATPRVTFAPAAVDLNELATTSVGMARPRAKAKQIELGLRESPEQVNVKADPLLLREVMTNLVNNAVDAAPVGGHVNVSTGRRGATSTFFTVTDDGPGVADENRHRLFEPHFTTKETGTGIGLFMSYGVIREHRGQLLYEGNRRGAVFTVVLPTYAG